MTSCSTECLRAGDTAPATTSLDQILTEGQPRQFGPEDRSAANAAPGEGESLSEPREGGGADAAEAVPAAGRAHDDAHYHGRPTATSNIEAALCYASLGIRVFPVAYVKDGICICGKKDCQGKHPMGHLAPRGFIGATTDREQIVEWWQKAPAANIGVVPGPKFLVVDLDKKGEKNGFATLQELQAKHGDDALFDTDVVVMTPSGGQHRWFSVPEGATLREGQDALGPGIDVRYVAGYVLAPPSTIPAGDYSFDGDGLLGGVLPTEAPAALIELLSTGATTPRGVSRERGKVVSFPEQDMPQCFYDEIKSALDAIPPDINRRRDGRPGWLEIGMALHSTNTRQAFELWDTWSQGGEKYDAADIVRQWNSFALGRGITLATLFEVATKECGWTCPPDIEARKKGARWPGAGLLDEGPRVNIENVALFKPKSDGDSLPKVPPILLNPPGILNDITQYVIKAWQRKPQPMFAVTAAMAAVATGLGRVYQLDANYTNLFLVVGGGTSSGKNAGRQALKEIFQAVGLTPRDGGDKPRSGAGIYQQMIDMPVSYFLWDEFGKVLNAAFSPSAQFYHKDIIEALLVLGTSASGTWRSGALSRDTRLKRKDVVVPQVDHPCAVIYATATPDTIFDDMRASSVKDGLVGRMLYIESEDDPMPERFSERQRRKTDTTVPQRILDWFETVRTTWFDEDPFGNSTNLVGITPGSISVAVTSAAAAVLDAAQHEFETLKRRLKAEKDLAEHVWARSFEMTLRVCVVCAGAVDPITPVVDVAEAEYAAAFVRYCAQTMHYKLKSAVSESPFHQLTQLILGEVQKATPRQRKRGITEAEANDSTGPFRKYSMKERNEAFQALERAKQIRLVEVARGRLAWVAIDRDAEVEEAATGEGEAGA